MGSILYDFLADSFLLNETALRNGYTTQSDGEIEIELARYREFVLKNLAALQAEAAVASGKTSLVASQDTTPVPLLARGALYLERFVVNDPLFAHTRVKTETEKAYISHVTGHKSAALDRVKIRDSALYLRQITPFVASDYVRVLPFSSLWEPPVQMPILYSETRFKELLPRSISEFMRSRAKVREVRKVDGRMRVLEGLEGPCRRIAIEFSGDDSGGLLVYELHQTKPSKNSDRKNIIEFRMTVDAPPPSKAQFDVWVDQSLNTSAHHIFKRATDAMGISASLNAMYLAPTPLTAELADFALEKPASIASSTVSSALSLDLPWLNEADPATLMKVRSEDGEAFSLFRSAFEAKFRELRTITDPEDLRMKSENAVHELTETQVRLLDTKIKTLQKKLAAESTIALLGFAGTVQTGGLSLLASAYATAQGIKTWADYREKVKDNPAYFALRLKKALKK